jgi:protein AroM
MIGLVVLGHSPREDHEAVYELIAPGVKRKVVGGLDSLTCAQARKLEDKTGISPLVCLLSDQTTVEIPLPVLFPYLKKQVDSLADAGASLAVVLCSGGFPRFDCAIPVVLPGLVVPRIVAGCYPNKKIGLIVPNEAQQAAALAHWKSQGVEAVSAVVSPYEGTGFEEAGQKFRASGADFVAIDCMGFKEEHREQLKMLCGCPVMLPKTLVARVALEIHESSIRQDKKVPHV